MKDKEEKYRLDQLVCKVHPQIESRSQAKHYIKEGRVFFKGKVCKTPGKMISRADELFVEIEGEGFYVGRGAYKLKKAIEEFSLEVKDRVVLDIGASTGGFTQVLLEEGACHVYAVDVGKDQLHQKLRGERRLQFWEEKDVRDLKKNDFTHAVNLVVIDVSFISLRQILPTVKRLSVEVGSNPLECAVLFKPQFEHSGEFGKKGVIRNAEHHELLLDGFRAYLREEGWSIRGECESPFLGKDGNKEFLFYLSLS